ncbi:YezD family protein [Pontiellaceae bacterium B12227]|nr:YezD family protein [Pontiellaceae bacterium B12227]
MNSKLPDGNHTLNSGSYCNTQDGRWIISVKNYVKSLEFGEVILTAHNGHVVQLEKTEKVQF